MEGRRALYGRKRGPRLRPGRRRLLEERLPELAVEPPEAGRLDLEALFPGRTSFWLEIGFGGGEHLIELARRHVEAGFIGIEPFVNGVARLLAEVEAHGLDNVRVFADDARLLLPALPDATFDVVAVLFPDPWPKRRHHKRRLISRATLGDFARILRPGGEVRLATDDAGYAAWMLEAVLACSELEWQARRPRDWRERPSDWPPTRYEEKALAAGARPVYLRLLRVP